jgi:PBP1b-binding outer membrane lipoprotein LpoB
MKRLILYIAGILFLAGCSTTKHLPEGEILYTGQKTMIVENRSKTPVGETAMEEVEPLLRTTLCWAVPVSAYRSLWDYGFTMDL